MENIKKNSKLAFGYRKQKTKYDFYSTPSNATILFSKSFQLIEPILEPCNGKNAITNILKEKGYKYIHTLDIDKEMIADEYIDFLLYNKKDYFNTIITNPPYSGNYKGEFIKKALKLVKEKGYVIMLLKLTYLEGKNRKKEIYDIIAPYKIFVHSERLDFAGGKGIAYAWFVWKKGYKGETILKWL